MIEEQKYPQELFGKLMLAYNPEYPVCTWLVQYLIDHGADLDSRLFHSYPANADPFLTIRAYLLHCIAEVLREELVPLDYAQILTTALLLLEASPSRMPYTLPRFLSGDKSQTQVICRCYPFDTNPVNAQDIADFDTIGHSNPHVNQLVNLISQNRRGRERRAYAVLYTNGIWPIDEKQSVVLFKAFDENPLSLRCHPISPGTILINRHISDYGDQTLQRLIEEIVSQNEPFSLLKDAYKYAGWTDEYFEKYYVEITLADRNGNAPPITGV